MMRRWLRWLYRAVLLLWREEWVKARIDGETAARVHHVRSVTRSELAMFRESLAAVARLHRDAAAAMAYAPFGQDVVLDLLEVRLTQLRQRVHNAAQPPAA